MTDSDEVKLLPCAYCGGTDIAKEDNGHAEWLRCNHCGATGPWIEPPEDHCFTGTELADQWNTRPPVVTDAGNLTITAENEVECERPLRVTATPVGDVLGTLAVMIDSAGLNPWLKRAMLLVDLVGQQFQGFLDTSAGLEYAEKLRAVSQKRVTSECQPKTADDPSIFDLLEPLAEALDKAGGPDIRGGFARMTGGVDIPFIVSAIASMPAVVSGGQSLGDDALPPSGLSQSSLSQAKPAAAIAKGEKA